MQICSDIAFNVSELACLTRTLLLLQQTLQHTATHCNTLQHTATYF